MRSSLVALVLLVALAGTASAHVEQFTQAKPLNVGPYNAIVQPRPEPMFANSALSMTAIFSKTSTGQFAGNVDSTLIVVAPSGANRSVKLQPDGTGYMIGSVVVEEPGNYTFNIVVRDQNGSFENGTSFTVYPDLPVRFRTQDPSQSDPVAGEKFTVSIQTLDRTSLTPKTAFTDLTLHLEHWKLDHTQLLGVEVLNMKQTSVGTWKVVDHVFPLSGMYHLRFSSDSGGFKPDDVPILHVNALDPVGPKETPAVPAGAILALGLVALALRAKR